MYGFNWTYISAGTTISALVWINFVNITLGDRFNGTFINAGSASSAVIINYVGHFKNIFDLALQR
jgi:hypothetical protein